jgi:hypothetical protein
MQLNLGTNGLDNICEVITMKKYVNSSVSTELHNLSKERLETIVSQIVGIMRNDTLGKAGQVSKTKVLLKYFNLIRD